MTEYNDARYLELLVELRDAINELLDMDGNDEALIREEIDNILGDR